MRDLFENGTATPPANPMEAAQRAMRAPLRKRFYRDAKIGPERSEGFPVLLDQKSVRTPAGRLLGGPLGALAGAIRAGWGAQVDEIDPHRMPLTRLANTIVDGVSDACAEVAGEVEKYLCSDLLFYRAEQ